MAEWENTSEGGIDRTFMWTGKVDLYIYLNHGAIHWGVDLDLPLDDNYQPNVICPYDTPLEDVQALALAWARRVLTAARDQIDALLAGELAEEAT